MNNGGAENELAADLSAAKRALLERRLRGQRGTVVRQPAGLFARPVDAPRLAALGQQSIWMLDQKAGDSPTFHISSCFRVSGDLDAGRLEASIGAVVSRHAVLRTSYRLAGDTVVPVINEPGWNGVERIVAPGAIALESVATREARCRFDLARGPLLRVLLIAHEGEAVALLMLLVHDIIFDGWSLELFWREVGEGYAARREGAVGVRPASPLQYEDFAYWQRSFLEQGARDRQLAYWKGRLATCPAPLPLPTDRPYPATLTDAGRLAWGRIPPRTAAALRQLAADENASLFMVSLLAYELLLRRLAGVDDVLIAAPVANRRWPETAGMIGFFLSTVPLRTDLPGGISVREAIRRVRETVTGALEHQDVPLEEIVAAVRPPREPGRHPLAQVMFVYQRETEAQPPLHLAGARVEHTRIETGIAKFDVTLFVGEAGDGFQTIVEYRIDLFDQPTMERWLEYYAGLIEAMVANPDGSIDDLHFLTAFEDGLGQPSTVLPENGPADVVTQIGGVAGATPERLALRTSTTTLTYGELWHRAGDIAAVVRRVTQSPAPRVGLFLPKCPAAIAAMVGVLRAGGAYVPVDPTYPSARIRAVLADAGVDLIVTSSAFAGAAEGMAVAPIAIVEEALPAQRDGPFSGEPITGTSPAYVIYTSGSTGAPKGVVVSHANLRASTAARAMVYGANPGAFLLLPSLSFDSSVAGIFWTLTGGGTLVLPSADEQRDPALLAQTMRDLSVASSLGIPGFWREILPWVSGGSVPTLRTMIVAGESCPPALVAAHFAAVPDCALFNEYGPTEASVWATVHRCVPADALAARVPIGRPIPGARIHLLDDHLRPVPVGVAGELWIGGAGVALGYHRQPEVTARKFCTLPGRGRCYRTGDRARWRTDGAVEFLGRGDRQVKVNGFRIELDEIESVLATHPDVADVVVAVEPVVADDAAADAVIARLAPTLREGEIDAWIREIKALALPSAKEVRRTARDAFHLALEITADGFVAPPRKAQRDWLLGQAMEEFADDLAALDRVARRFVPGSDQDLGRHLRDSRQARLTADEIMEDWQVPLMRAMATHVTGTKGDVLEIGFGRGVSAEFIQQAGVRSHTVVEMNDHSVEHYFVPWRARHAGKDIRLFHGRWQDVEPRLDTYDGIFFHAFPMTEAEFVEYILKSVTFAEHAFPAMAAHLRPGGVFTYLTTEIDSLSRRHQRALFRHFRSITLHVEPLRVPADTHDAWWADAMVVIKATK